MCSSPAPYVVENVFACSRSEVAKPRYGICEMRARRLKVFRLKGTDARAKDKTAVQLTVRQYEYLPLAVQYEYCTSTHYLLPYSTRTYYTLRVLPTTFLST